MSFQLILLLLLFFSTPVHLSVEAKITPAVMDLHSHEITEKKSEDNKEYTLPDLHGNTLKLLQFLRQFDFVEMDKENYQKMVDFYNMDTDEITDDTITKIKQCISSINKGSGGDNRLIRLIGDELADRGSNDYFTLLLLDKMNDLKLNYEIIWSNHGDWFLQYYETKKFKAHPTYSLSLIKFCHLSEKYQYIENEVKEIMEKSYKPYLRAMAYTEEADNHLTLYTHAVAGPKEIEKLARELNAKYDDSTISALKKTIDNINKNFRENFVNKRQVHTLDKGKESDMFIWRRLRHVPNSNRPHNHKGYTLSYVHGHDMSNAGKEHIHNLDKDNFNFLGRPTHNQGPLQVYVREGTTKKEALSSNQIDKRRVSPLQQPPIQVVQPSGIIGSAAASSSSSGIGVTGTTGSKGGSAKGKKKSPMSKTSVSKRTSKTTGRKKFKKSRKNRLKSRKRTKRSKK